MAEYIESPYDIRIYRNVAHLANHIGRNEDKQKMSSWSLEICPRGKGAWTKVWNISPNRCFDSSLDEYVPVCTGWNQTEPNASFVLSWVKVCLSSCFCYFCWATSGVTSKGRWATSGEQRWTTDEWWAFFLLLPFFLLFSSSALLATSSYPSPCLDQYKPIVLPGMNRFSIYGLN